MSVVIPKDIAEIICVAGVAAMNRCQRMAGGPKTIEIHERYFSSIFAAELWQQLNETIKCNVIAEATYTEFYKRYHPEAQKKDVDSKHGGKRFDVLISFPAEPADILAVVPEILIEVKFYNDGKRTRTIAQDQNKLRSVSNASQNIKKFVVIYVTQDAKDGKSLSDRVEDIASELACDVIAGKTQVDMSGEWEWCFATLEVLDACL